MSEKLICQECSGGGGWIEPVLDFGQGPWEQCGWCQGSGFITAELRGQWLKFKRELKYAEDQAFLKTVAWG